MNNNIVTFEDLLKELEKGKTFQDIVSDIEDNLVECTENEVYWDQDFHDFLDSLDAEIEAHYCEPIRYIDSKAYNTFIIRSYAAGKLYTLPCQDHPNRFQPFFSDETIITFNRDWIEEIDEVELEARRTD